MFKCPHPLGVPTGGSCVFLTCPPFPEHFLAFWYHQMFQYHLVRSIFLICLNGRIKKMVLSPSSTPQLTRFIQLNCQLWGILWGISRKGSDTPTEFSFPLPKKSQEKTKKKKKIAPVGFVGWKIDFPWECKPWNFHIYQATCWRVSEYKCWGQEPGSEP